MKPFYQDNHNTIYCLDFRKNELPNESVQMVCTSPPYWGLRKYEGEQELIWGDNHCKHQWGKEQFIERGHPGNKSTLVGTQTADLSKVANAQGSFCLLCGAWRGAFGLEPTPEMYIQHTIEILREIRRVLRKDGVVFWNIGDSYASGKGTCFNPGGGKGSFSGHGDRKDAGAYPLDRGNVGKLRECGLKPKDLCLIPFRIAIACQEDGWWVRSVIIWSKPNPMPESVTDRPTESHEYILMLTKSARYYWDADAVREQSIVGDSVGAPQRDTRITYGLGGGNSGLSQAKLRAKLEGGFAGRNIRTVWEFPTQPGPDGVVRNFAVFPEKLPELCIKAATPEVGCCSKCGVPWIRITKHHRPDDYDPSVVDERYSKEARKASGQNGTNRPLSKMFKDSLGSSIETIGWQPTCKCDADKIPSLVLDPFAGAGTTLWVAKKLNRRAVGYEISEEYCQLAVERCRQQVLL